MPLVKPPRLLLLGAPGSGKGTQTTKLLLQFPKINSLSSGDILRNQINSGTSIGLEASKYIKNGKLVPDTTMVRLITKQLHEMDWFRQKSCLVIRWISPYVKPGCCIRQHVAYK